MAEAKKKRAKTSKVVIPEDPIPFGMEITDTWKKKWLFGTKLGSGGCGVVYEGSNDSLSAFSFVIKIEHHENGPLFTEQHVYHHIGKQDAITQYAKKKKLSFLGIPVCHGTGSFMYNDKRYRFLVLRKYGKDLQRILDENGNRLNPKTVFTVGIMVVQILEYIHSLEYIHGDIKAGNLLLGPTKDTINNVYLLDMGLATRYMLKSGEHKSDTPDPKKANNGTPEFLSVDAHKGVFSRRSDLEILGYNMLFWLAGTLPWVKFINDPAKLKAEKERYLKDIPQLMKSLFPNPSIYSKLQEYMTYVSQLNFDEPPDYVYLIRVLNLSFDGLGIKNDGILILKEPKEAKVDASSDSRLSQKENNGGDKKGRKKAAPISSAISSSGILPSGEVLTPAMLAVLNRQREKAAEKPAKKPRKKAA